MHQIAPSLIRLYASREVDQIPWPSSEQARHARLWIEPMLAGAVSDFIENIRTDLYVLIVDDYALPITVNTEEYSNAFVCNIIGQYTDYGRDELRHLQHPWLKKSLFSFLSVLKSILKRAQLNRVVSVNNWMCATNLYPKFSPDQVKGIKSYLSTRFPKHAILFRSLNTETEERILTDLETSGFQRIFSRPVWMARSGTETLRRQHLRRDLKLLEKTDYQVVSHNELSADDAPRILELYKKLYLDKHSQCNVCFHERFIRLAIEKKILIFTALKRGGVIDAVVAYNALNGVVNTPFIGYDVEKPRKLGLYRMASALLVQVAAENQWLINHSSGAAEFKRNRGAWCVMEFHAVYTRHLSWHSRAAWKTLGSILNPIAAPLSQRMGV